ncbi:MAG: hypothetical protein IPM36_20770 [Lewinellaceae bacterium]|nr:hypothetical protein [Lewinellaceae bacterium]
MIEARERKRRRGFWWWWMGAGLLALLLAGWWFFAEGGLLPQRFAGTAKAPAQENAGKTTDPGTADYRACLKSRGSKCPAKTG